MNCLYIVFAFNLETCNVEESEYCEPYAAGVYHAKDFNKCFNGDSNKAELVTEKSKVHVFNRENSNPFFKKVENDVKNYKGKPEHVTDKHGN